MILKPQTALANSTSNYERSPRTVSMGWVATIPAAPETHPFISAMASPEKSIGMFFGLAATTVPVMQVHGHFQVTFGRRFF